MRINGENVLLQKLIKYFFYFALGFYAYNLVLIIIGNYDVGFFDGMLKVLSMNYTMHGLTPYLDFGVVYPPGLFILIGKVLPFNNIVEAGFYIGFIYLILNLLSFLFIYEVDYRNYDYLSIGLFLLFNSVMLRMFSFAGAVPHFLMLLIFASSCYYLKHLTEKGVLLIIFLTMMIGVWFRWDWTLIYVLISLGSLFVNLVINFVLKKKNEKLLDNGLLIISLIGGYFSGIVSLYAYLLRIGAEERAFMFAVEIPLMLTRTYRDITTPWLSLPTSPNSMFYINFIFIFGMAFGYWKWKKEVDFQKSMVMLLCIFYPMTYFTYVMGRSDWWHFLVMWYAVGMVWLMLGQISQHYQKHIGIILIMFLPVIGLIWNKVYYFNPRAGIADKIIDDQIKNCKDASYGINAKSIFVGRTNYDSYLFNSPGLYMIFADLPPATSFITEEPGVQSSCKYGGMVAEELAGAEKPMMAFLDKSQHKPDNKYTKEMRSCDKIENFLENQKHEVVGECKIYGFSYEIRLYQ